MPRSLGHMTMQQFPIEMSEQQIKQRITELEGELSQLTAIIAQKEVSAEFVTFTDVKKMLGLGDKLTRRLIRQGRIPYIRVGPRKCLFNREAVLNAMHSLQEGGPI